MPAALGTIPRSQSSPHLLLALLFVLHLWTNPFWLASMLIVAIAISVLGWRMGRPRWTYPWPGLLFGGPG